MSDSSYYDAGSGFESTVPGHPVPGPFPDISMSGSSGLGISPFSDPAVGLSSSRDVERTNSVSRFREEFGDVLPDPSPRPSIASRLRALSRHGRPSANSKRADEDVTNHVFLSDYDAKDAQAHRKMLYHGCPQAAESAPEGWYQALRGGDLSAPSFYLGKPQSVNEFGSLGNDSLAAGSPGMPGFNGAAQSTSELVPSPLRTIHTMPRDTEDSPISRPPMYRSVATRDLSPWAKWPLLKPDSESSDMGYVKSDDSGATTGHLEPVTPKQDIKRGMRSVRWPFSRTSGNARKPGGREELPPSDGYQKLLVAGEGPRKLKKAVSLSSAPAKTRAG
ncbi:hypothetical protein IMZ48_46565 [Candidatus Bathyarchaeota archaeon]|nr:hypothetical protein [Candidatus Bathyarchaeota archaeon]